MMQNRRMRRHVLALGTAGLIAVLLPGAQSRAAPADVAQPVRALNAALLDIMRAGKATAFAKRFDMLAPAVDRAFNLEAILQAVVGSGWPALAEADKAALRVEFRRFTIASWVANFDAFNGEAFTVKPETRPVGDGGQVVETQMAAPGGTPVGLSYVMRQGGADWKAVDILAEGTISRVAVMRSDFRRVLASGGGAGLVAQLREKTAALMASQGG